MDHSLEICMKIASVAFTVIGALLLFVFKWILDTMKEMKEDIKDIKKILQNHENRFAAIENRLTAIETGLKMFEWFEFKKDKVHGGK